jgi:Skp family chaperone for outer membrane proteins
MDSQDEITILEEGLNAKLGAFQAEYQRLGGEYQSKMAQGLLSPDGQKFYENKIRKIELDITSLQETEGAALQDQAMKFQEEFLKKLEDSAKEYAEKNGINLFLAKEKIGVVLYADSVMDVTMDFVKFMNDAEKESNK